MIDGPGGPAGEAPLVTVHLVNHLGRGGTERQLYLTLRHLDPSRWQSHVVVFNPSPNLVWDEALAEAGVGLWKMPPEARRIHQRLLHLAKLLRRLRPQVVQSWTVHDNPYAALAGLAARVPVCWGALRGTLHTPALDGLSWPLRRLVLRGPQKLVVNCEALGQELRREGVPGERIAVVPNCVEVPETLPEPADLTDLGIPAGAPLVGSIGNLRRIKNHEHFVDAMAVVLDRVPAARGIVVGQALASEPEYRQSLEERIRARGLEGKVVLAGFREDVGAVLQRLSVLCLTSHSEGSPNSVLEAMAAGRPVAAVDVGGVGELVRDGVNGALVPPGDAEALGNVLARLLEEPDKAEALGRKGREIALQEHSCRGAAEKLGTLYLRALSKRSGGPARRSP